MKCDLCGGALAVIGRDNPWRMASICSKCGATSMLPPTDEKNDYHETMHGMSFVRREHTARA